MPNDNSAEVHILDIPYHTLLPKMGVFLAYIDALQHLRKEIVLIWRNPPAFEKQTKKHMRSCPRELGLQQPLTKLGHEDLCFCCGLGADTQVV